MGPPIASSRHYLTIFQLHGKYHEERYIRHGSFIPCQANAMNPVAVSAKVINVETASGHKFTTSVSLPY